MPFHALTPYKLTKTQKKALIDYLEGRTGIEETAKALRVYRTRIYVMVATIARHAASTGKLDAKTLIAQY
jgi:hypothetical protein